MRSIPPHTLEALPFVEALRWLVEMDPVAFCSNLRILWPVEQNRPGENRMDDSAPASQLVSAYFEEAYS